MVEGRRRRGWRLISTQLMGWALTKGARSARSTASSIATARPRQAAVDLRRPDRAAVAVGVRPARPAVEPRRRDDRRLFRADLGDAAADRAVGGAAGRGSSPPPSRTITRPSPPRAHLPAAQARRRDFEYQPTKLHTKLVVLDDVVHIGSSNFDIRSLYLNMEMMLRVDDPEFAR
jgi:phosphatidylserine/phosphatidylglycerophosphate/cardiolipin synthase-like enzyme